MAAKVLLATTCRWFSAARLAVAFGKAGCAVEAVCPPGHPLRATRVVTRKYAYSGLTPRHSFEAAIASARPDLIIPCDDLAMKHLHAVYWNAVKSQGADSELCRLLARSLGDPASYPITESRDNFMATINAEGIRAPETKTIASVEEVRSWLSKFGLPAVLKADGTSGGEGVKIVHTVEAAVAAYRTLHAPLSTLIAAKRTCLDGDLNCVKPWLVQQNRVVSIQTFVFGPDANMAVACWQGEILSSISVEVLETWKPKGPSTIVRLMENREMYQAAETILRRLKFSGLCGLDFMIDRETGQPYLIEMNARATQTCSLALGQGRDPVGALCSTMIGQPVQCPRIEPGGDTIALFPAAWQGDTSSRVFTSAYHDIPWEEPELVALGMRQIKDIPREKWRRVFGKMGLHRP